MFEKIARLLRVRATCLGGVSDVRVCLELELTCLGVWIVGCAGPGVRCGNSGPDGVPCGRTGFEATSA